MVLNPLSGIFQTEQRCKPNVSVIKEIQIAKQKGRYWYMAGRQYAKQYFKNPFHRPQNTQNQAKCLHSLRSLANPTVYSTPVRQLLVYLLTQNKDKGQVDPKQG